MIAMRQGFAAMSRSRGPARLIVSLAMVAACLGGCGGKGATKVTAPGCTQAVRAAPAYRVGQYCIAAKQAKYRTAGFKCERHHLARR